MLIRMIELQRLVNDKDPKGGEYDSRQDIAS
jgi:hypothetical protein